MAAKVEQMKECGWWNVATYQKVNSTASIKWSSGVRSQAGMADASASDVHSLIGLGIVLFFNLISNSSIFVSISSEWRRLHTVTNSQGPI